MLCGLLKAPLYRDRNCKNILHLQAFLNLAENQNLSNVLKTKTCLMSIALTEIVYVGVVKMISSILSKKVEFSTENKFSAENESATTSQKEPPRAILHPIFTTLYSI